MNEKEFTQNELQVETLEISAILRNRKRQIAHCLIVGKSTDKGSFGYMIQHMSFYDIGLNWDLYTKTELIERFWKLVDQGLFHKIADFQTFLKLDQFKPFVNNVKLQTRIEKLTLLNQ